MPQHALGGDTSRWQEAVRRDGMRCGLDRLWPWCSRWAAVSHLQPPYGPGHIPPRRRAGATTNNSAYMAELQRQAATQAQMAAEQQRRIQEMMALQQQTNDQLAAMKRQEEERKQAAAMAATNRDKDLAEQARQALGRYGELGERAKELDRNNRDLYTQMAQIQQRSQLLEDQNYLLRQRLKETSDQLASAMQSGQVAEQRLQAVQASTVRRGGATITANSSLKRNLTAVTVPGLNIRQDGELVRIELPADQLFENGTATLRPDRRHNSIRSPRWSSSITRGK